MLFTSKSAAFFDVLESKSSNTRIKVNPNNTRIQLTRCTISKAHKSTKITKVYKVYKHKIKVS